MTTPAPTPQAALDALKEAEDYLRNCANSPALADKCGAALAQAVTEQQALAESVVWLNLADNGFTEKDLGVLKALKNLEKL